jgi:hypothetical protein
MTILKCTRALRESANRTRCYLGAVAACAILVAASSASGQALSSPWVELGDSGKAIARIVVSRPKDCPAIRVNGESRQMSLRQPTPDGLRPVCEFEIPPGAKSASIDGQALTLPTPNPNRVIALGDTGCRIKGKRVQDCNDPDVWPFRQIAASAASEKPELIIDVGDYLYRESPCPNGSDAMCGGTPNGDNWEAWNIDFFSPAAKLLAAAPWVFTRGNHENCEHAWRGWFYYLDPRPWNGACAEYTAPYKVKLGTFELAMLDASTVKEDDLDEAQATTYAAQLTSLEPMSGWLLVHYPFWGFKTDPHGGPPVSLVASLQSAWEKAAPRGISMILSGHIHLFEFVSVDHDHPAQIVVGIGGTEMAVPIEMSVKGTKIRGATVMGTASQQKFGYTVLSRSNSSWKLELKDRARKVLISCPISEGSAGCQTSGSN